MSLLDSYGPPGNLDDLDETGLKAWNMFITDRVTGSIKGPDPSKVLHDSPRSQFYDLTKTDTAADAQEATVTWTAFPRLVKIHSLSDTQRWQRADASRDVQDEYCEWSVTRNTVGKITKVMFTCEGPEYWKLLSRSDPAKLLELYQKHVSPSVKHSDLFGSTGNYNPRNRWNDSTTHGAMHLIQVNNTLSAEIELAAAATIVRVINGKELATDQELISCSQYGEPERNSDPHIGGAVNALARQKADISLANPVGLYFDNLATDGWTTPDGSDPKSYWIRQRGDEAHPVRFVYEVPEDKGFTVGDITINGKPIQFGAQIADFITIKLTAIACRFGQSITPPQTACVELPPAPVEPAAVARDISAISARGYHATSVPTSGTRRR
ncbi:hypothetical protein E5082_31925 [Streptomyces griseoluteus]|uniref:Uncharacterized protein n=1 Tax=Streptomyces griseoluteus TaxID=29306 RepID=A0A4Z1CX88_STRGP|nr:hypothetical protein [Streptomyces griseoluteus]TGN73446.1 hypothetical protein E5082_31925 [Streptomyces griseoluteus]GHF33218.1 hypothetical protein GCM10017776_59650 [Streptomyces griseoluteus]